MRSQTHHAPCGSLPLRFAQIHARQRSPKHAHSLPLRLATGADIEQAASASHCCKRAFARQPGIDACHAFVAPRASHQPREAMPCDSTSPTPQLPRELTMQNARHATRPPLINGKPSHAKANKQIALLRSHGVRNSKPQWFTLKGHGGAGGRGAVRSGLLRKSFWFRSLS